MNTQTVIDTIPSCNTQIVIDTITACNSLLSVFLPGMTEQEKIKLTLDAYQNNDVSLINELTKHNAIPKKLQHVINLTSNNPGYEYIYKFDLTNVRDLKHVEHLANKLEQKELVKALIAFAIAK